MTDLHKDMKIMVTTVVTVAPSPGDRPADLPDGEEWPVTRLIIYQFGQSGTAICSGCITDPEKVSGRRAKVRRDYGAGGDVHLHPMEPRRNDKWRCTVPGCSKFGDPL